ncbi:MAG: hypothetical protein KAI24_21785 [Planctomycetes bacterium]|nr:hypothetical protein [Planctomycetota bacterium]
MEIGRQGDWVADAVAAQTHELHVTVAPAFAVAVRFRGDEVVGYAWKPAARTTSFGGDGLSRIRLEAQRDHPEALLAVVSSRAPASARVQLKLLVDFVEKGTHEFLLDARPVHALSPTVNDVSDYPDVTQHAYVAFQLEDAAGRELSTLGLLATNEAGRSYPVRSGVPRPLPPGRYRLSTLQPAVAGLFTTLPEVTVGAEDKVVSCKVDVALSTFQIWPVGLGGRMPDRASVVLTDSEGGVLSERFVEFSGRTPLTV